MRLVDADALIERLHSSIGILKPEDIVEFMPTACDINAMKEEIAECLWNLSGGNTFLDITREEVEKAVLKVIDKHTKGRE